MATEKIITVPADKPFILAEGAVLRGPLRVVNTHGVTILHVFEGSLVTGPVVIT